MFWLSLTMLDEMFITWYHPILPRHRTKRRIYVLFEVKFLLLCIERIQITTFGHMYFIQVKTISPGSRYDLMVVAFLVYKWVLITRTYLMMLCREIQARTMRLTVSSSWFITKCKYLNLFAKIPRAFPLLVWP